jgi:hypothetical protein
VSQLSNPNSLADLPDRIANLISAIPAAAHAVTAASVDSWSPDGWPPLVAALQNATFSWKIQISKDETQTFLFFIQIPQGEWVMLEATASIGVTGAWGLEPANPLAPDGVQYMAQFPAFLQPNPSDDFANLYKPLGADAAQTMFLTLGPDGSNILAVTNPDQGKNAMLRYSPGGVPGTAPQKGYPLSAFVDLGWTLRDWIGAGAPTGAAIPVASPGPEQTQPQQVLTSFAQAYLRCVNALRADKAMQPPFDQRFRLTSYSVSIDIALAKDGSIAETSADEQSRLDVDLCATSGHSAIAIATLTTASFIVSGAKYDEVIDSLCGLQAAGDLAAQLEVETADVIAFCTSARPQSVIFRTGRSNGEDKLLLMLSGEMKGYPEIVLIRADYDGTFDFLDIQPFDEDPAKTIVSFNDVGHWFMPLIAGIRFWANQLLQW